MEDNTPASLTWVWMPAIWSAIALFEATGTVFSMRAEGMHHNWNALFLTELLAWLPWALVTPLVIRLRRAYSLKPAMWFVHAVTAVAVNSMGSAWVAWIIILSNPYAAEPAPSSFTHLWFLNFCNSLLNSLMIYAGILAVDHILEARERLSREQTETAHLNEQLSRMQLDALRRQIEPHFLFNSLNSISGLVRDKQTDAAVTMIARLSEFLRRVLEDSNRQLVPLVQEMEVSEKYLEIQKARFADRMQLSIDVPESLMALQVPCLILQPMVENAVKHGISKRARGGAIRISATRDDDTLTLRVYNDGPPFPAETTSGVGMANVLARLKTLYGDRFRLSVMNQGQEGVEVSLSLPCIES